MEMLLHHKFIAIVCLSGLLILPCRPAAAGKEHTGERDSSRLYSGLQTPEPGTRLNPIADLILHYANTLVVYPDSVKKKYEKRLYWGEPRMNRILDTTVVREDYAIPVRVYYPRKPEKCNPSSIIVYFHGGGFVFGNNDTYDGLLKKLAHVTRCIVISAEYRLSPGVHYPVAVNDCYFVLQWVASHMKLLGAEGKKIGVAGDSAGGNLAAVMTLMSRDKGGPPIAWQVLYYPSTTMRDTMYRSRAYFAGSYGRFYMLSEDFMMQVKKDYLGAYPDDRDPYVSPLDARLTPNLPPALIVTAKCDPLRDEGGDYAHRLAQKGVPVMYREAKGMIHGFISFYPLLRQGRKALRLTAGFINELNQPMPQMKKH